MRYVDRSRIAPPEFLLFSPHVRRTRRAIAELFAEREASRSQSLVEKMSGEIEYGIERDLHELFEGRCAMCETREGEGGLRPYLFRPATEAEPIRDRSLSHLYYAWLTTSWDNWLLVCEGCRPRNPAYFPVEGRRAPLPPPELLHWFSEPDPEMEGKAGPLLKGSGAQNPSWSEFAKQRGQPMKERPLLLDPTSDQQLHRHLHVNGDGFLEPISPRGSETTECFNLNRESLRRRRAEDVDMLEARLGSDDLLFEGAMSEFGFPGSIVLRMRFLISHMAQTLGVRPNLRERDLANTITNLIRRDGGEAAFNEARKAPRSDLSSRATIRPTSVRKAAPAPLRRRITRLSLKNFKSLEDLELVLPEPETKSSTEEMAPSVLILGENATGKSSILEAGVLALVDRATRNALEQNPRRLVLDPSFMDSTLEGGPSQATVTATFDDKSKRRLTITKEAFHHPKDGEAPMPVFAYGAFRQYLDAAPNELAPGHYVQTLFQSDTLLPNPEPWLIGLNPGEFTMVARSLSAIFTVEGKFDVIERQGDRCFVVIGYAYGEEERKERTPLKVVSSGFRAVLAMACDIMRGLMNQPGFQSFETARAIVFIDEIEAHLHPRWKIAIMSALRKALPAVTFVVTSHDPLCLRGMRNGEVMVLNRVRGESAPNSDLPVFVEKLQALPNIEELTIEQLLTADFFQLNSTDSPKIREEYARFADLLRIHGANSAEIESRLTGSMPNEFRAFARKINEALPVGDTEVQTIVQEAVADYLAKRGKLSGERMRRLRQQTKDKILNALEKI